MPTNTELLSLLEEARLIIEDLFDQYTNGTYTDKDLTTACVRFLQNYQDMKRKESN